jgi:diguanylate cyclase (GGDEF)-like protein/PAS domain S-box-containing protein
LARPANPKTAATQALSQAETVLAVLADGVVVRDVHGDIVSVNPAAERMLQVTARKLQTDGSDSLGWRAVRTDGSPFLSEDYPGEVTARTGQSQLGVEMGIHRPDGTLAWLEVNSHPLVTKRPAGSLYGAVTSFHDLTVRRAGQESTRFQAALLDAVGQAVVATDPVGSIIYWNRQAQTMYGWSAAEVLGRFIVDVTPSMQSAKQADEIMRALSDGVSWMGDFPVQRRDGSTFPALVTQTPLHDGQGRLIAVIGVSTDMTERGRSEAVMRQLSAIVESTGDAIIGEDLTGGIVSWNHAAEQLYGYLAEEMIGQPSSMLAPPERLDETVTVLRNIPAGHTVTDLETQRQHRDGRLIDVAMTVSPVFDWRGRIVGGSVIARDISERKDMQRALEHQALHDALTGLPNRVLVDDRLRHALASRSRSPVAVLFLDLDNFKNINDATGHHNGDAVLIEVARRLERTVRPDDTVARFGGDEFVIVCEQTDEVAAHLVADRILAELAHPIEVAERVMYISASIGISVSPPMDGTELLRFADAAMYDAKARGRSRAVLFDETLANGADERWQLSNDLRSAIESDSLQLWYQPIVDLDTGDLLALEALCRWDHPTLGMVPPDRFVPVAEATGLSTALDKWVLRAASGDARRFMNAGLFHDSGHVAVNISARSLSDAGLEQAVRDSVHDAGVPYRAIALEVTETGVMADPDRACRLLEDLQSLGVSIALDDFGTGYSSLTYLRRLPVSTIKIDRSFVSQMVVDPGDLAIVVSIVDLARSVHLTAVAEGVETVEQLEMLRRLGCRAGQGYLWSRPVPAEEILALVADGNRVGRSWPAPLAADEVGRRKHTLGVTAEHGLNRLMQLHHAGSSLTTIAAALNQEGFHTPRGQRWHTATVARTIAEILQTMRPRSGPIAEQVEQLLL